MGIRSLNRLRKLRVVMLGVRRFWLKTVRGIDVSPSDSISLSSRILSAKRGSIHIGPDTLVAFKTLLYSRDPASGQVWPIRVGKRCFIGGGAVLTPGVTIGDESIVAAGAIVLDDVPPRSIVAGNPARVVRTDIRVGRFGRMEGADDNTRRLWR